MKIRTILSSIIIGCILCVSNAYALGQRVMKPNGQPMSIIVRVTEVDQFGYDATSHWFLGDVYNKEGGDKNNGTVIVRQFMNVEKLGDYQVLKAKTSGLRAIPNGEYKVIFITTEKPNVEFKAICNNYAFLDFKVYHIPIVSNKQLK